MPDDERQEKGLTQHKLAEIYNKLFINKNICTLCFHLPQRLQNWFCPTLSSILAMALIAVGTVNFYDTWSLWQQRQSQGMGAHLISLQVAVRRGKSSWNSWLIWVLVNTAPGWRLQLVVICCIEGTAAQPLERNKQASKVSCKVEVEQDGTYETVDSPRSTAFVFSLWCGTVAADILRALIPVKELSAILHERVITHCWIIVGHQKEKKKHSICEKHNNQMPQSCWSN